MVFRNLFRLLACLSMLFAAACTGRALEASRADTGAERITIATLSGSPERISGGNVLVRVTVPRAAHASFRVLLNGHDVTRAFRRGTGASAFIGLVDGLKLGPNRLEVRARDAGRASLELTNYPTQGPIISGPHVQPFICQTERFVLADGRRLGPPLDADCSAASRITYLYLSTTTRTLEALPSTMQLPSDVARTTTTAGATVNFIARIETTTINRGIYESVILHDPVNDPAPTPFSAPRGWNGVLIALHGTGCTGGWYTQGGSAAFDELRRSEFLDIHRLGQGYATYINTLQNPSDSCNAFLAGETAMMGKEHFIKSYGVPRYSLSLGSSGGAYTTLQVIDAFPGLFDGALIRNTFPDALSIGLASMDAQLLRHYFSTADAGTFSEPEQVAVSGYQGRRAWHDAANQAARTDPVPARKEAAGYTSAVWNPAVPADLRYDPVTNPKGARPTIWDISRNIYGVERATGVALRVFDNVGVQYGLVQLNTGVITKSQFLDLNERIGGYDRDDNPVGARTAGDEHAISEAYLSGLHLSGRGGLSEVPVLDLSGTYDDSANYHYQWYHFAVRERLIRANGDHDNHVMWRGNTDASEQVQSQAFQLLNRWVEATSADSSPISRRDKVRRNMPASLRDGCWTAEHEFIAEEQYFSRRPDSRCNALLPSFGFTRLMAGGPLAADILKCTLKPIDLNDYTVSFTRKEQARLRAIFPEGVCDWSSPGRYFDHVSPGRSYGPAPSHSVAMHTLLHEASDADTRLHPAHRRRGAP